MDIADILQDGIDLNHINHDTALSIATNLYEEFIHFPIHTKHPNTRRLKNIEMQMEQEGRVLPTWEENLEIDQEFGTTFITLALN